MDQTAYDLEMFENRGQKRTVTVRSVKGKGRKTRSEELVHRMKLVAVTAIMVALVCALIASQVRLTELTGQIQSTQRQIVNAQSDYNYLSGLLDSKTGQRNVEEIASTQLGLMKIDRSQITYFTLDTGSSIRRPESTAERIAEFLTTGVLSLADYLNP